MSAEELDHIFDPGFRVNGSRVSTGNWSLFSARQVLYEHGGDIIIDSASGQGTTVRILLPA
jgi:signal transduction histidine kinase